MCILLTDLQDDVSLLKKHNWITLSAISRIFTVKVQKVLILSLSLSIYTDPLWAFHSLVQHSVLHLGVSIFH